MNSYSIREWYGKWIVVKTVPNTAKKLYLTSVRNGAEIWMCDPLYARPFSKQTAMRHLRECRASDPECEEDY